MTRDIVFAVPGDLATPTGGYAYDRRVIAELKSLGWQVDVLDLGGGFPAPSQATYAAALARLRALPPGRPLVIDGLAFGVMDDIAAELARTHPLIALVHHPLALETGLSEADAATLRARERTALAAAHAVVVTSPATARLLRQDFDVAPARITVAIPGADRALPAQGSCDGIVRLLSVGSVVPRKGYDVLMEALATMTDLPWRLTIAGARDRDGAAAARLDADITRFRLQDRVTLAGAVETAELDALYAAADLFVLASRFEGYGMAFTEAVAHGLPIVGTSAGAIVETVPAGTGVLVPSDDAPALATALRRLIESEDERRGMAAKAHLAAHALPTWHDAARHLARAIEAVR